MESEPGPHKENFCLPPELSLLPEYTLAQDARASIRELYQNYLELEEAGWKKILIYTQQIESTSANGQKELLSIPIYAFESGNDAGPIDYILISGIHGGEPAGPNAIAQYVKQLIELGKARRILVLPFLNPWGYFNYQLVNQTRHSPNGKSVGDMRHLFGRIDEPACPEAAAIGQFFIARQNRINAQTRVLNFHEDASWEGIDEELISSRNVKSLAKSKIQERQDQTYIYVHGNGVEQNPLVHRIIQILRENSVPFKEGNTAFEEPIINGMVINVEDGSLDQLLFELLGVGLVIVPEILLETPTKPPIEQRITIYTHVLEAFFGNQ